MLSYLVWYADSMATATRAPGPPRRHFLIEIWEEKREVFKMMLADFGLFSIAFGILYLTFLELKAMEARGYPANRLARFEEIHFWAYYLIVGIFLFDLVMKLFVFLILGKKIGKP